MARAAQSSTKSTAGSAQKSKPTRKGLGGKVRIAKEDGVRSKDVRIAMKPLKAPFWVRVWRKILKMTLFLLILACVLPVFLTVLYLPAPVHPVSTLMLYRWASGQEAKRTWVALENVSPFVTQSVISSEDGQFCFHSGVDWDAVNLVMDDLMDGESPRGASTIPMQTVKNTFLWSNRSYIRKVLEVPLALLTDKIWGKRRMMEIYLNIAEWGPGVFGIEQAAQTHFGVSAAKLSRKQAALLAVTLPNPILRSPAKPKKGLQKLARTVEKRAAQSGAYIKCLEHTG